MKEFFILVAIILLGFLILRVILGSITIIIWGKAGNVKTASPFMRVLNFLETIAVVTGYIILVVTYYTPC